MPRPESLLRASRNAVRLLPLAGMMGLQASILAQGSSQPGPPDPLAVSYEDKQRTFEKLWDTVDREYFDPQFNGVNWPQMKAKYRPLVDAATNKYQLKVVLQSMLDELHTSHLSVGFNVRVPKERIKQAISGKVSRGDRFLFDLGISLAHIEGHTVVDRISDDSGAHAAGVRRGWILTLWNGEPYPGGLQTACDLGEKVNLRFLDLQGQQTQLDAVCRFYRMPDRSPRRITRMLDGGTVYLRFTGFVPGANGWLADQVTKHRSAPAIIIDLRGNVGGHTSVLRECFEPFFPKATILGQFRDRRGKEPTLRVPGCGKNAYSGRVFVLIDEASASAAEIFAAGFQESGRGIVIGRKSSGNVLNSYEQALPSGFKARIPIRDYQTSEGTRLEGRGVIPDVPVELTMKGFLENADPDMERVSELLQKAN